jgi:hypothetical protein
MKLRTRSILQELNEMAEVRNQDALIESRATNIINSAINLLESIHKQYTPEAADELERRLSIKSPRGLFVYAKRVYNKEYILGK